MSAESIKILENGIRQLIKPDVVKCGFSYDSSTRTFRKQSGECLQIMSFQIGVRSMEGQFTVNLAVFHPEYREPACRAFPPPDKPGEFDSLMEFRRRLSSLRDTPLTKFFRKRIRNTDSFLKWWLVTPTDYWWTFTEEQTQVATELGLVRELFLARGLDWLNQNSDVALLKAAYEKYSPCTKVVS